MHSKKKYKCIPQFSDRGLREDLCHCAHFGTNQLEAFGHSTQHLGPSGALQCSAVQGSTVYSSVVQFKVVQKSSLKCRPG